MTTCKKCVLQRYVEDPFLLNGRKFSLGVYTAFMGVDPLSVWIHREMLVLLCSHNFTNDALQVRLRPTFSTFAAFTSIAAFAILTKTPIITDRGRCPPPLHIAI